MVERIDPGWYQTFEMSTESAAIKMKEALGVKYQVELKQMPNGNFVVNYRGYKKVKLKKD